MTRNRLPVIRILFATMSLLLLGGLLLPALAQQVDQGLPLLTAASLPLYPRTPLIVHIQGVVKMKVTTDGTGVSTVERVSGPPMLIKATEESIRTWKFEQHKPTTFVTTFTYVIDDDQAQCTIGNAALTLNLPQKARIDSKAWETCDPVAKKIPR